MKYENLGQMLSSQTIKWGTKPLVYFNKQILTYKDADIATNKLAKYLESLGVLHGDRVSILMRNCPEYILTLFAIFKLGAIAVPINNMLRESEIAYILNNSESKILISMEDFAGMMPHFRDNCKDIEHILSWGDNSFNSKNIFTELSKSLDTTYKLTVKADDTALFFYTSGTTGFPKGAMITHSNLLLNIKLVDKVFSWDSTGKFLLFLPLFHSYTLLASVIYPVYCGCSIIMLESVMDLKTKKFRNILIFKRPRIMLGVPPVYDALIRAKMPKWFIKLFYPIKLHISGGAPISEETLDAFKAKFGVPILEGYGLSEASPLVSFNRLDCQKAKTVGQVLPGISAKIIDDDEKELPIGEVGELIIKGPNVMKGYWKMPKATDDAIKNGWLFTGDFAKLDKDNFITIVDRKKDLILSKGMNIYPREIEETILDIDGVEAASVIGVPTHNKDERIVAYVKLIEGSNLTEKDIKDNIRTKIAAFKMPRHIHILDELPLTATGKVLKRELKRMVLDGEIKSGK